MSISICSKVDLNSPCVVAGAAAVSALLATIGHISDDCLGGAADGEDTRDYSQIADAIDTCLQHDYTAGTEDHRRGLLLALADVLCKEADSRFGDPAVGDPLQVMRRQAERRAAR